MPINGAAIVEYSLKTLLMLIDAWFLLATVTLFVGAFKMTKEKPETKKEEDQKVMQCIGMIFLSLFCGIVTAVLFGLAVMPWWV